MHSGRFPNVVSTGDGGTTQKNEAWERMLWEEHGRLHNIYDDPPSYWFHVIALVAESPLHHDAVAALPLFRVLAYADIKAHLREAQFKAASFSLFR